jgi:histidinol-phosphate aminotransferase
VDDYLRQVTESKALLYGACERLALKYWKSSANFVLVSIGERTDELVRLAGEGGVYIRNRSTEPGCSGCIRVTTGVVEHTKRFIATMEAVLCVAR